MFLRSYIVIFVAILTLLGLISPVAYGLPKEAPIRIQILNFAGSSLWRATETTMVDTGNGRYRALHTGSIGYGGTCKDFLSQFQERPLNVMLKQKYISPKTADFLKNHLKDSLSPQQLLLVSLYSEFPEKDVDQAIASGQLSEDRVMQRTTSPETNQRVARVSRGTLYALRGQIAATNESGKFEMKPQDLAWELDNPLGSKLERKFDRSKIQTMVEVGRAHSEDGYLPGDFKLASRALSATLASEYQLLGIPLNQVLMTAHFLDSQHTRFFTRFFPLRPLSADIQKQLENDLVGTLSNYLKESPMPKNREEWKLLGDSVTYGSLQEWIRQFPVEEFSDTAARIVQESLGKISGVEALQLVGTFTMMGRQDFDYQFEGRKSKGPLMIRDLSILFLSKISKFFKDRQMQDELLFPTGIKPILEKFSTPLDIDFNSEFWTDRNLYLQGESPEKGINFVEGISVTNLDKDMAAQYPMSYLVSVILSVRDHFASQFQNASPETYSIMLEYLKAGQRQRGLPVSKSLDEKDFFDIFPILLNSSDPLVRDQLSRLGGETRAGMALFLDFLPSGEVGMKFKKSDYFLFTTSQLNSMRQAFPDLDKQAKRRLSAGAYKQRLQILHGSHR